MGPFSLQDDDAYLYWRDRKLQRYPLNANQLVVEVGDLRTLTTAEHAALTALCRKANMAIYACSRKPPSPKDAVHTLGRQFGLTQLDHSLCADDYGIAAIRVTPDGRPQEYIPYTNRPLKWHTDGYYNSVTEQIQGVLMHCIADAASGGGNTLLDPEVLYILMRDENPEYIAALMQPDAMTIPPNLENGCELRPRRMGPVFSVNPATGALHMRYTARTRSIEWKENTREAVSCLESLLNRGLPYIFRVRLEPGQGILCNNVLHTRDGFADDLISGKRRILLRARYYDRIART